MDISDDDVSVTHNGFLTGNPALRISGDRVQFTNKAGGWIFSNPDHPQTEPVILLTGAQIVFINENGGNIRASAATNVVLQGSDHADHIENYGILDGKVSLGGGNDYFFGLIDTSLSQPTVFDLGDGDDLLVLDVSGSNYLPSIAVEGGAGYDRVVLTGYHSYATGFASTLASDFSGIERIDLQGLAGAPTTIWIQGLRTTADLYVAPAMSVLVGAYLSPKSEIGAIHLNGGYINIINGASVGDIFGGDASEWVQIGYGGNTSIATDVGAVWLGGGSDSFFIAHGHELAVDVHGGDGGDLLRGGMLADLLHGDGGGDRITGSLGDDVLDGGLGNDSLDGGEGSDSLTGGGGADIFAFTATPGPASIDTISDFETGVDRIYLSPFTFSNISASALAASQFHTGTQAISSQTRIIYNSATGALLYDIDGTGSTAAVQFATLAPGLALNHQHFTLAANGYPTFDVTGRPIVRISTSFNGDEANGSSVNGSFAPNGRFVLFESSASNLTIASDTNGVSDIFLKNLLTGSVTRLSNGLAGAQANGASLNPIFSADGTKVLFQSVASNLVAGDTPGTGDLFLLDFATGQTSLVSASAAGAFGNGGSFVGGFSPDGTKVVFISAASNLVAGDTDGTNSIFIKNLLTGEVSLVASAGALLSGMGRPAFSPDGTKILFQSEATDLVGGDTNGRMDLFLMDLVTGTITRVSTDGAGAEANHLSSDGVFSPDGTKILFQSAASNLVAGDTNNNFDIFLKDLTTGQVTLVSGFGNIFGNGGSTKAVFSPDGTRIAFVSFASNLVAGDTNGQFDIFVKDLTDGSIIRVSVGATGAQADNSSQTPAFSADGISLIFHSGASNLVAGDTNSLSVSNDMFVVELGSRYSENGTPATLATSVAVADDSDNYLNGYLMAWVSTGFAEGDQIGLAETGGVTVAGNMVMVNGITVGMISGSGGQTVRIELNANADDAAVTALTLALRFSSSSDDPVEGTRIITVQLADAGAYEGMHYGDGFTHRVFVTAVNDAPVLVTSAGQAAFIEGADAPGIPVAIDPGLVITDVDASRITNATVNVIQGGTGDLLGFNNDNAALYGDIQVLMSAGGALTLITAAGATLAQWQNALRAVTYTNTDDAPVTTDRIVSFILRDSDEEGLGILSTAVTRVVTVTAANDSPTNHLPGAQVMDENHVLTFGMATGNAITISDPDAVGSVMTVTIAVADGALALTAPYASQSGAGTSRLVLTGSVEQLNAALDGLTWRPPDNVFGARTISVTTNDGGWTGAPNLIVNPGAETGAAGSLGSSVPPPGWTVVSGHMSAVLYEAPGSANLVANDPSAGTDYFAGGTGQPGGAPSVLSQTIDLLAHIGAIPALAEIDAGLVRANLSGWFGGRGTEGDHMVLTVRFLSAGGQALGTATLGGVLAAERGGQTSLLLREAEAALPPGTRAIELVLTGHHVDGPYIDAYADQLSLTLSRVDVDTIAVEIISDTHDILFGNPGPETMAAGPGNDIYYVDSAGDIIIEHANEGTDIVYASVGYTLNAGAHVELLTTASIASVFAIDMTGNELNNTIWGNNGNNTLSGGIGGQDTLVGFLGNDIYLINNTNEVIVENAGEGTDIVYVNSSYTLSAHASIELLSTYDIAGTAALNLTGNNLDNTIWGNRGNNMLSGGIGGQDTLVGFLGDDVYLINNTNEVIVEHAGEGTDIVYVNSSYTLSAGASIELLSTYDIAGTQAFNMTGNELSNTIWGNRGNNTLSGGIGGNDTLVGFLGDDNYLINNGTEVISELANEGTDIAYASVSYVLSAGASIELLTTSAIGGTTAINLTGNELVNTIWGNAGANLLDGGAGSDTLLGFGGADTFAFTTALGASNIDILSDFVAGTDKIALDDAIFSGIGTPGAFSAAAFVSGTAAADADDRIVYNAATGQLFYDADGNGAGAAVLFATLQTGLSLAANDFAVI